HTDAEHSSRSKRQSKHKGQVRTSFSFFLFRIRGRSYEHLYLMYCCVGKFSRQIFLKRYSYSTLYNKCAPSLLKIDSCICSYKCIAYVCLKIKF
ncbi:mCG146337, partial [Mus musculus]